MSPAPNSMCTLRPLIVPSATSRVGGKTGGLKTWPPPRVLHSEACVAVPRNVEPDWVSVIVPVSWHVK